VSFAVSFYVIGRYCFWTWTRLAPGFPVAVFILSIPIGFVNTTAALLSWLVLSPVGFYINRKLPPVVSA
jgi:hypothetical protein